MSVSKISFKMLTKLNKNGEVYKDYPLKKLTTFKIGGKTKYLIKIATLENFIKVMMYLAEKKCPYYVLGNGSNVLASDSGYDGIVIKLIGDFDRVLAKDNLMECGAGVSLTKAFVYAREKGLSGFECGVGIPATIGGATYMNAQCNGFEMANIIDYVVAYHNGKITYLKNSDCDFGYRYSIFQNDEYIILRVGFKLVQDEIDNITARYQESLNRRHKTQPVQYPSAGCVFKRMDGIVVSQMLDQMGAKNYVIGGAKVSDKHANFIINFNVAKSEDVMQLINNIRNDFYTKYNVRLETELKLLGEFNETIR